MSTETTPENGTEQAHVADPSGMGGTGTEEVVRADGAEGGTEQGEPEVVETEGAEQGEEPKRREDAPADRDENYVSDLEQRVTDAFARLNQSLEQASAKAKQVADDARKASAALALWLVISLFVGAFVASLSATLGGRLRDSSVLEKT